MNQVERSELYAYGLLIKSVDGESPLTSITCFSVKAATTGWSVRLEDPRTFPRRRHYTLSPLEHTSLWNG